MKTIQNWEQFNEAAKKNYTAADVKKDFRRIEDIVEKGHDIADKKGTKADDEMLKLAVVQANKITNVVKAENRGKAAEEENYHSIAKVFFDRAKELIKKLNEDVYSYGVPREKWSDDEEIGGIELKVDDKHITHWYYLSDAIQNGLLEEYFDMSDGECEEYAKFAGIEDAEYVGLQELSDMLQQDFDEVMDSLTDFLNIDEITIEIKGNGEDGDYAEIEYFKEVR